MEINCLSPEQLSPILDRKRNPGAARYIPNIPLKALLTNILEKANDFVPSEAGSILLDDPLQKRGDTDLQELIFVCCFGPTAYRIVGERIPANSGIAGNVYRTGVSIMTNNSYQYPDFSDRYDRKLGYRTESVLCVAIRIGKLHLRSHRTAEQARPPGLRGFGKRSAGDLRPIHFFDDTERDRCQEDREDGPHGRPDGTRQRPLSPREASR